MMMNNASPYRQNQLASETPREVEQHALAMVTGRLHAAQESQDRHAMISACYDNQKLWKVFMTDLANPANALPPSLRADLISLGIWVGKQTSVVMQGKATADSLISVNRSIMEGLAGQKDPAQSSLETPVESQDIQI